MLRGAPSGDRVTAAANAVAGRAIAPGARHPTRIGDDEGNRRYATTGYGLIRNLSRRGARRSGRPLGRVRGVITGGVASALVVVGAVAFATPAFAQDTTTSAPGNVITSTASCNSPLGTGVQITWTLANNSNVSETGSVTTVTGGSGTLNTTTYSIPPSSGQPAQTATLTQTLPAGATGVITLEVSSTWADAHSQIDSGTFDLSTMNCGAPHQTIAGHIYLCNNGNPTTTEETGGTLAASGTGLSTVPPASNPSAPTDVIAGDLHHDGHQSAGLPSRRLWWLVVAQRSGHVGHRVGQRAERRRRRGPLLCGLRCELRREFECELHTDHRRTHLPVRQRQPDHL